LSAKGSHLTAEHKEKLRVANLGKHHSAETRAKMSASRKGKPNGMSGKHHSAESRAKIAMANSGANNYLFGKHQSAETLAKLSAVRRGRHPSAAARAKMGDAHRGKPRSSEVRAKVSAGLRGRKLSAEHRIAMAAARRKWWQDPKVRCHMSEIQRGERGSNWRGGLSFLPYSTDWTSSLRRAIRERDRYTCQLCGMPQGDIALDVHHVDYDKKNCSPSNLVTLCRRCHGQTHHNRGQWIVLFGEMMMRGSQEQGGG
jgi:hypothetical protein